VFEPVSPPTTFEETVERLGTAIRLGLLRLHGIENELELEAPVEGKAYESDAPRVPGTLAAARDLFAESAVAREAFGDEVVDHYLNHARVELEAFESAITDWEKFRGFERL